MKGKMISFVKKNIILILAVAGYLVTFFLNRGFFLKAVTNCFLFLKEMLEIMPAVFVITGLIAVWIPRETITRNLGQTSGLKGKLISLFVGSFSAGPIYAAFPIGQSLLKKGASISNLVVIISAWAVIKVPMLIVEAKFLGLAFTVVRYLLTVPAIFFIAFFTEKIVKKVEAERDAGDRLTLEEQIHAQLPQHNCRACGYEDCKSYALAVASEAESVDLCVPGKETTLQKIMYCLKEFKLDEQSVKY